MKRKEIREWETANTILGRLLVKNPMVVEKILTTAKGRIIEKPDGGFSIYYKEWKGRKSCD